MGLGGGAPITFFRLIKLNKKFCKTYKGSRKKKSSSLALRPMLNGRWNFGTLEKKGSKKSPFFLNGPTIKRRTYICVFPKVDCVNLYFLLVAELLIWQTSNLKTVLELYRLAFNPQKATLKSLYFKNYPTDLPWKILTFPKT